MEIARHGTRISRVASNGSGDALDNYRPIVPPFRKTWQDCTQDALSYCGITYPSVAAAQFKDVSPCRILLTGLKSAGKSTLLEKYVSPYGGRDIVYSFSSLKLPVEKLQLHAAVFVAFNAEMICPSPCCGHVLRVLQVYLRSYTALVWIVDVCDRDRLSESLENLQSYFSEGYPSTAPLLILANK
jgi:hypothetical protein